MLNSMKLIILKCTETGAYHIAYVQGNLVFKNTVGREVKYYLRSGLHPEHLVHKMDIAKAQRWLVYCT